MELTLPVLIAVIMGAILKKYLPGPILTKAIPWMLFATQIIGRVLLELGAQPANAAGFGDLMRSLGVLDVLRDSVVTTLLAVGVHSTWKNAGRQLLTALKERALIKAVEVTKK